MKKHVIDPVALGNVNEWKFPIVDINKISEEELTEIDKKLKEENEKLAILKSDLDKKILETEELKSILKNQIDIFKNAIDKLKAPIANLEPEMTDLMVQIMKKTVKKLVLNEIQIKPEIIASIINSLNEYIVEKDATYSVMLSESDYNKVSQLDEIKSMTIKTDPALNAGDIVIKSNHAEIRSILDERIDKFFESKTNES